jgi:hypothetical protein
VHCTSWLAPRKPLQFLFWPLLPEPGVWCAALCFIASSVSISTPPVAGQLLGVSRMPSAPRLSLSRLLPHWAERGARLSALPLPPSLLLTHAFWPSRPYALCLSGLFGVPVLCLENLNAQYITIWKNVHFCHDTRRTRQQQNSLFPLGLLSHNLAKEGQLCRLVSAICPFVKSSVCPSLERAVWCLVLCGCGLAHHHYVASSFHCTLYLSFS